MIPRDLVLSGPLEDAAGRKWVSDRLATAVVGGQADFRNVFGKDLVEGIGVVTLVGIVSVPVVKKNQCFWECFQAIPCQCPGGSVQSWRDFLSVRLFQD
eukprot:s2357_g6.t1